MKQFFKLIFIGLLASVIFTGCNSNKADNGPEDYYEYYNNISRTGASWNKPSTKKSNSSYNKKENQGPRTFSKSMRLKKYYEQNGICAHCGKQCSFSEMEGDHIVPYSLGGKTTWDNLQMLCKHCNRSKSNKYCY